MINISLYGYLIRHRNSVNPPHVNNYLIHSYALTAVHHLPVRCDTSCSYTDEGNLQRSRNTPKQSSHWMTDTVKA
jgi:hypothetical protein